MQCRNCGAPIRGHECEYCGSHYGEAEKPVDKEKMYSYINMTSTGITMGYAPIGYKLVPDTQGKLRWVDNV